MYLIGVFFFIKLPWKITLIRGLKVMSLRASCAGTVDIKWISHSVVTVDDIYDAQLYTFF